MKRFAGPASNVRSDDHEAEIRRLKRELARVTQLGVKHSTALLYQMTAIQNTKAFVDCRKEHVLRWLRLVALMPKFKQSPVRASKSSHNIAQRPTVRRCLDLLK